MATHRLAQHQKTRSQALGRLFNHILVLLVVSLALVTGGWRAAQLFGQRGELYAAGTITMHEVIVSPGDTLWELAIKHGPQGEDPRKVVNNIREINALTSVRLVPGMVLLIPTNRS